MDYTVHGVSESDTTEQLSLSVFFMVQLAHPYLSTGKTIALTRWAFVVSDSFDLMDYIVHGILQARILE